MSPAFEFAPQWHEHRDEAAWSAAIADSSADALRRDLATGHARLLLSGGSTPAPAYRALANYGLDWARVRVALVDERWLPPGDADSNALLVQETLLQGRAAAAQLEPILIRDRGLDESVREANRHANASSVALLGMGPDGHTASLFPGARGLAEALASGDDYVSVDAAGCAGAGNFPLRISLTPAGLARATCACCWSAAKPSANCSNARSPEPIPLNSRCAPCSPFPARRCTSTGAPDACQAAIPSHCRHRAPA